MTKIFFLVDYVVKNTACLNAYYIFCLFSNKHISCFFQVIKNFHLYGLLFALLGVDCILLTAWMIISPYESGILELPAEVKRILYSMRVYFKLLLSEAFKACGNIFMNIICSCALYEPSSISSLTLCHGIVRIIYVPSVAGTRALQWRNYWGLRLGKPGGPQAQEGPCLTM